MNKPTDHDIAALVVQMNKAGWDDLMVAFICVARAALEKWGQPVIATKITIPTNTMEQEFQNYYRRGFEAGEKANQPAHSGEPVATVGSWTNGSYSRNYKITWHRDVPEGTKLYTAPQPVEREPLTPIRKAALDLYTPPFRCEHGYVRDANNQMVADDGGEEMVGVIAARIRGWGRIQYMDNPKGHAAALQDEVGEIVAQALNEHWATHGIKGGQHADT